MNNRDAIKKVNSMVESWFNSNGSVNFGIIDRYATLLLRDMKRKKVNFYYKHELICVIGPIPMARRFHREWLKGE